MPVISQRLRVAQVILDFFFQSRRENKGIEQRLRMGIAPAVAGPDPMMPVNILDSSLIEHALCEAERSLGMVGRRFTVQGSSFTPCGTRCPSYDQAANGPAKHDGD